jgi:hypothetical protein
MFTEVSVCLAFFIVRVDDSSAYLVGIADGGIKVL